MEGWDGTRDGKPSELTYSRGRNFGLSGAKLIWGGEATAVRPDGRANPNQLMILDETMSDIENLRRFNGRIIGIGGFINISQNAKKVIFSGVFTAGPLEVSWVEGKTVIHKEGPYNKFVAQLEQVSYNGPFAGERGQEALYITERDVFRGGDRGIELIEIGPGVDLERDVLAHMDFCPQISTELKTMDARLFHPEKMGLEPSAIGLKGQSPVNASSVHGLPILLMSIGRILTQVHLRV